MEAHRFGGPWKVEKLDALGTHLAGYPVRVILQRKATATHPIRRHAHPVFPEKFDPPTSYRISGSDIVLTTLFAARVRWF